MSVNIHVPSVPGVLRITQTMWEDLILDPVKAASVIMGYELDVYQRCRLRYYWWVMEVIDSSGFSSGKTIVDWIFLNLRCVLLEGRQVVAWYYTFSQMQRTFWKYYKTCPGKIWRAQLGGTDERGEEQNATARGPSCYVARYKNGSLLEAPATNVMQDMDSQSSTRYHDGLIEEWTHMDATGTEGIDQQLKGRCSMETFNKHHPIWGNHILMTAPAKTRGHPGWPRVKKLKQRQAKGDPRVASLHYSYKDMSDLPSPNGRTWKQRFRADMAIDSMRTSPGMSPAKWLGEGLGIWGVDGLGVFSEEALEAAQQRGEAAGIVPVTSRAQFLEEMEKLRAERAGERSVVE